MRIIAGEFRGRKLLPPVGDATRPITDRAKQSLFDILTPHIDDAIVYDLFSGTGSMGLECLSRGAAYATFFEADRSAQNLLQKNIATLKVESRSKIIAGDLFRWFATSPTHDRQVTILFLDPPYRFLVERADDLQTLADKIIQNHLAPNGLIIFRHDEADQLNFPNLHAIDTRSYGSMQIEILAPKQ
jgi:16S rRNA (guanine966-N2)-methyltransferase